MDQPIERSDYLNESIIRLCDSCGKPLCTECLRENILGFYYCQHYYPVLFKNISTSGYEIPHDEEEMRRIQKQTGLNIDDKPTYESIKRY
jgi:hypothetical protein